MRRRFAATSTSTRFRPAPRRSARLSRRSLPRVTACTVDPEQQVTVCCGSTEAMLATMLACVDPGDEVIVFEPFYENYGPGAILAGRDAGLHPARATALVVRSASALPACVLQSHARDRDQHAHQSRPGRCSRATSSR